jgi:precorrin-4/cobalt-precorrin-4 C11-methyltransferase
MRRKQMPCFALGLAMVCASAIALPAHDHDHDHGVPGHVHGPEAVTVCSETGSAIALSHQRFSALKRVKVEIPPAKGESRSTVYEGVAVGELLRQAGVALERACERPQPGQVHLLTCCVVVESADGYRAVFSIAEVDAAAENLVLLADRRDGKPLADSGPFQIVESKGRIRGRWVRSVSRILVQPVSTSAADRRQTGAPVAPPADAAAHPKKAAPQAAPAARGKVYLVGTGPGDPELMTFKAAKVIERADVVFCFDWTKGDIASRVRPGQVEVVSRLLVGGRYCGCDLAKYEAELRQRVRDTNEEFQKLSARVRELVREGKTAVFAADGDPTLYSPWGWITEQFADLDPVVVPGISSLNAANAALRHGAVGTGSLLLSSGADLGTPDQHGRLSGTVVFFTHSRNLEGLLPGLRSRYPADTPLAIVCEASYPGERVIRATLGTVQDMLAKDKLPHLYLLYVGDGLNRKHNSP